MQVTCALASTTVHVCPRRSRVLRLTGRQPRAADLKATTGGLGVQTMTRNGRERGDGALFFNTEKDRWVGHLDLGRDLTGKRVRPTVSGHTRVEVRAKFDELRAQAQAGRDITERDIRFADLADQFFDRGLPAGTSPNTRENYQCIVARHLLPALGNRKVAALRPNDIEDLLQGMATRGYSGRTMRLALNLARRILRFGERRGVSSATSPPSSNPSTVPHTRAKA